MLSLVLYSLLSTALYYLGSRALITRPLWGLYPPRLSVFMDCAACTGFWYGLGLALTIGQHYRLEVFNLPIDSPMTAIVVGLCMLVLTPIIAGLMQRGLDSLGVAEISFLGPPTIAPSMYDPPSEIVDEKEGT